jgi:prepilin-type processing-associated H-X9-DG protein
MYGRRGGFSTVELLMVIALIAVLIGLLLPVLAHVRENGRRTACLSNLQQLHRAFALYAQDHDGNLPPYQNGLGRAVGGIGSGPGKPGRRVEIPDRAEALTAALAPYLKNGDIWFCPSDRYARSDSTAGLLRHRFSSYRVHQALGLPLLDARMTLEGSAFSLWRNVPPSAFVLATDNLWPYPDPLPPGATVPDPDYDHRGNFNYLYLDGHAKSLPWRAGP